jgi:hypothetical protein|tara:strand:+ start:196 stop:354 length:159 start_codon:yes stop_codon:yes gene_type:complete
MEKINNPWEHPYYEEDYENPDCDCYGCATMRHSCKKELNRHKDKNDGDKTRR